MHWVLAIIFVALAFVFTMALKDRPPRTSEPPTTKQQIQEISREAEPKKPVEKYVDDTVPYACRPATFDQATCEEQKRGNAEMGRYLLNR